MQSYPEAEPQIRAKLTPRGEDLLNKVKDQCIAETIAKFMFRHLHPYFTHPIPELMADPQFRACSTCSASGPCGPTRRC